MKPTAPLVNLLIAKSILETVLVGTIAVVVYTKVFPPTFKGWVVDESEPWRRVEVQLFIDGKFVGTQVAQLSRPDVVAAGWGKDEWHGYSFVVSNLPEGGHEARVYAQHASGNGSRFTLQLL